jgi:competence protein ComEC
VWIGASGNRIAAAVTCGVLILFRNRNPRWGAGLALVAIGLLSGVFASLRATVAAPSLPLGSETIVGIAVSDPAGHPEGFALSPDHLLVGGTWKPWSGPLLYVRGSGIEAGEPVLVRGRVEAASFRMRSGSVSGVIDPDAIERLGSAPNPLMRVANRLRRRVLGSLDSAGGTPAGALVAGFLIGDTRNLPETDYEALRLSGLSHFVAVSGSNVALFLAAWWMVTGPLGWGPRRRAVLGLVGIVLFAVVTRWEPSVVRASVMAAAVLVGRLAEVPIAPWAALGWSVTLVVAVSGGIVHDVGFQLSVAATAGLLAGGPLWSGRRPRWLWTTLGATLSAQAAVAPILLHHFGTIPLFAPLTNLMAAPLVVMATALGGLGTVTGIRLVVRAATGVSGVVLAVARSGAGLPQLHTAAFLVVAAACVVAALAPGFRPVLAIGGVLVLAASSLPASRPDGPTVAFLDVGQGDAEILTGPSGEVIVIDGGPDPSLMRAELRNRGIRHIDLLIVSHRHADHTTGLVGITSVASVDRLWFPQQLGEGSPLDQLVAEVSAAGGAVSTPAAGTAVSLGAFTIEVLGPLRRYESPNDGSIVVRIRAAGVSVVFTGDIEAIAQHELGPLRTDIMKVPHQGSITSDLDWLRESAPSLAVISVGPNDYGHPADEVIGVLEEAGATVMRTDRDGTVTVRFDRFRVPSTAAVPSAP